LGLTVGNNKTKSKYNCKSLSARLRVHQSVTLAPIVTQTESY